jgi:hypothetical protein
MEASLPLKKKRKTEKKQKEALLVFLSTNDDGSYFFFAVPKSNEMATKILDMIKDIRARQKKANDNYPKEECRFVTILINYLQTNGDAEDKILYDFGDESDILDMAQLIYSAIPRERVCEWTFGDYSKWPTDGFTDAHVMIVDSWC